MECLILLLCLIVFATVIVVSAVVVGKRSDPPHNQ